MWWTLSFFTLSVIIFLITWNRIRYVGKEISHPSGVPATKIYGYPWGGIVISVILETLTIMGLTDTLYIAEPIAGLTIAVIVLVGGVALAVGIVALVLFNIFVFICLAFFGVEIVSPRLQKVSARVSQRAARAKRKMRQKPKLKRKNDWP